MKLQETGNGIGTLCKLNLYWYIIYGQILDQYLTDEKFSHDAHAQLHLKVLTIAPALTIFPIYYIHGNLFQNSKLKASTAPKYLNAWLNSTIFIFCKTTLLYQVKLECNMNFFLSSGNKFPIYVLPM